MPGPGGLALTWLDVFTDTPLQGNGLAVVHDAGGLDDGTMLAFARETRLSETTFVQPPTRAGADYRNRIWMVTGELPFAGHPSLGTAVAVAAVRGEREADLVQQTQAGLQPVHVELAGHAARASMLQEPAVLGEELDPGRVLGVLGLDAACAHPELPPQVVSTGVRQVVACVAEPGVLAGATPDLAALNALLADTGAIGVLLAHAGLDDETAVARYWFPETTAAVEDPATGSAAGPLMALLHARTGARRVTVLQGVEMGRASRLACEVAGDRVRVGGDVVLLALGRVFL